MLNDVISISLMSQLFKNAKCKLTYGAMQLYQNVLNNHFNSLEETIDNLNEFALFKNEIPNYSKYEVLFTELQNANFIHIDIKRITFYNVWSKYIEIHRLKTINNKLKDANTFKDNVFKSQTLLETVAMKSKVSLVDVKGLLEMFFAEQESIGKQYYNEADCRKHFIYWSNNNISKVQKPKVISKSKILGNE